LTPVSIMGVGLLGPGLPGWAASRAILAGEAAWQHGDVQLPPPAILPATERRRTGPVARLALAVATEAAGASGLPPASLRPVFGSGNGDGVTLGAILDALCRPDGFVSPTQFHNSVHNAAAGYWSIGNGSGRPATCLGGYDWTFGGALMKAVAECAVEQEPVLLCVYDVPLPAPLDVKRPMTGPFGVALVLAPDGAGPRVSVAWDATTMPLPSREGWQPVRPHGQTGDERACGTPPPGPLPQGEGQAWRLLSTGNPAARALPLLEMLARGESGILRVPILDGALLVTVTA
jgi:hypothetical protein